MEPPELISLEYLASLLKIHFLLKYMGCIHKF
jgi:hypothetical protein